MSNKDFKVKNKLQVAGITSAGPLVSDASGNVDSTSSIATQYGGTGTTTSPTSGQILYSSAGTTYAPTNLSSLGSFPVAQISEPSSPADGLIWVDTDGTALINQLLRWSKATANGTTTLSGNDDNSVPLTYSVGYEQVFQNGALLARSGDYTATNGTTISLTNASVTGDIFEVFAAQPVAISDVYTQTQANAAFINDSLLTTTGDTIYASGANTPARLGIGTTGQVLTVSGGVPAWSAAPSGPAFRAYRATSQQSFSANTPTKVQFNAESFDTDNCFDSTTNYRFTPNKSGYYQINSNIAFSGAGATTIKEIYVYKNGSRYTDLFSSNGSGTPGATCNNGSSTLVYFNGTTDYAEIYVYDSDGTARNVQFGEAQTTFSGVWIRS